MVTAFTLSGGLTKLEAAVTGYLAIKRVSQLYGRVHESGEWPFMDDQKQNQETIVEALRDVSELQENNIKAGRPTLSPEVFNTIVASLLVTAEAGGLNVDQIVLEASR